MPSAFCLGVLNNLKMTVGFMDTLMQDFDNISRKDRVEWRREYNSYMEVRNRAEDRYNYLTLFRQEAEVDAVDKKRKPATTTTEIVLKRQKTGDWEEKDLVGVHDTYLHGTEETGNVTDEEEAARKEREMDVRGIFEVDSDSDEDEATAKEEKTSDWDQSDFGGQGGGRSGEGRGS